MIKQLKPLLFIGIALFIILLACNKNDTNLTPTQTLANKVIGALKDSVSKQDFSSLDSKRTIVYKLDEGHKLLQISTQDSNKFVLIETDNVGTIIKGKILHFTSNINGTKSNQNIFNGNINVSSLNGNVVTQSVIVNNQVSKKLSSSGLITNSETDKLKPLDEEYNGPKPPMPEVIVVSYLNSNLSQFAFNLLDIAGIGDYGNEYIPIYPDYGGSSSDILTVNIDVPEDKKVVDPQKMIDCFGTISNVGASYTISIEANLPVDGMPNLTVNPLNFDGGHTFVTLTKTNSNGESITQVMGFYPVNSIYAGSTLSLASMIVNDQNHKYNASYTINVSSSQFQNALNQAINLSSNNYNLLSFNCTDFALGVFNAGGGSLNIMPNIYTLFYFNQPTFTPNSLYLKLQYLSNSGDSNAKIGISNAASSHGPC